VESASIEYRSFGLVAAAAAGKEEVLEMDEKPSEGSRFSATLQVLGEGGTGHSNCAVCDGNREIDTALSLSCES
jgi:transposase-like protein